MYNRISLTNNDIKMKELSKLNKTMSSSQISEMLGYEKKEVNKKIRSMFGDKKARENFSPVESTGINAGKVDYYNLPEKESKMFVAKYDIDYLEKVIEFWIDKSSLHAIPQNFAEALQLSADQAKQIEFKDDLIIASNEASVKAGDILVSEFVKSSDLIDLGRNQFYEWMREQGYIFKNSCEPIQSYVKRGLFKWLPTEEEFGGKIRYTLYITARGKVWLAAKYMNFQDNE